METNLSIATSQLRARRVKETLSRMQSKTATPDAGALAARAGRDERTSGSRADARERESPAEMCWGSSTQASPQSREPGAPPARAARPRREALARERGDLELSPDRRARRISSPAPVSCSRRGHSRTRRVAVPADVLADRHEALDPHAANGAATPRRRAPCSRVGPTGGLARERGATLSARRSGSACDHAVGQLAERSHSRRAPSCAAQRRDLRAPTLCKLRREHVELHEQSRRRRYRRSRTCRARGLASAATLSCGWPRALRSAPGSAASAARPHRDRHLRQGSGWDIVGARLGDDGAHRRVQRTRARGEGVRCGERAIRCTGSAELRCIAEPAGNEVLSPRVRACRPALARTRGQPSDRGQVRVRTAGRGQRGELRAPGLPPHHERVKTRAALLEHEREVRRLPSIRSSASARRCP